MGREEINTFWKIYTLELTLYELSQYMPQI